MAMDGNIKMFVNYGRKIIMGLVLWMLSSVLPAFANSAADGVSQDWQLGFSSAATPVMERMITFHNYYLLPLIVVIVLFVLLLLAFVCVRFYHRNNPVPSRTTHHVGIEIIWTVVPVLILMWIAIPSIRLLYFEETTPKADLVVKAIGYQWYWGYEYPDQDIAFDSYMLSDEEAVEQNLPRKLATDTFVVVPVNKVVQLLVTAQDVIHSWAIPAFGTKVDAVPGRMNQTWIKVTKEGTYYGQCSELCGINHAFMPIMVKAVPEAIFNKWQELAKQDLQKARSMILTYEQNMHSNQVGEVDVQEQSPVTLISASHRV